MQLFAGGEGLSSHLQSEKFPWPAFPTLGKLWETPSEFRLREHKTEQPSTAPLVSGRVSIVINQAWNALSAHLNPGGASC